MTDCQRRARPVFLMAGARRVEPGDKSGDRVRHRAGLLRAIHRRGTGAIAAGGILLIWPALANGYPLLFTDTGSFLEQLLRPFMIWDKPWIYGPVLVVVSLKLTLWLPALAQGVTVSWVLWRVQRVFRSPSAAWHLGLCVVLVAGSAAPWFASLLMPDILAPLTVLTLFVLAFDRDENWRRPMTALATFAIAAHLSHLVIASACVAVVLALRPRAFVRASAPLAAAVALLMATNLVGHGRLAVSPYGAVFGLARLVADGPARDYLEMNCPEAGYALCDWVGRLPADTETFLWSPSGPVWTFPGGPIALAPEASRIVTATILSRPWSVAGAALDNAYAQLGMVRLDKVLGGGGLDETVGVQLQAHYPVAEESRFKASEQRRDGLRALSTPCQSAQPALLVLGGITTALLMARSGRRDRVLFALIALIAAGILSNAFATGGLSGPTDRYQARIAWLVLLPPILFAMRHWDGASCTTVAAV